MTSAQPQTARPSRFSLSAPRRSATRPPPRVLIYGEPGIGKTTFGCSAPDVVLIPTEDGSLGLDVARLPTEGKCETWADVMQACKVLLAEEHNFKWVVIDTINQASHLCEAMVCERDFGGVWNTTKGAEGFSSYGKGEKAAAQEMRALLSLLDQLQQKRGMGVILLGHVGLLKQANALGADFYKFAGEMSKNAWALVCSWADQVGHACREMRATVRDGETKAKASAIGSERWIVFEGGPGRDAKSRAGYEMPEKILLSWDEYISASDADRIDALVEQAFNLSTRAPDGARASMARKLGGQITKDGLRTVGKQKLEATIGWLLSMQQAKE